MKFSLIVCTLGRYEELDQLFESLRKQTYSDFEVILVDQNDKDYLNEIINEYSNEFDIRHIFSEKGLSRARNIGLKYVSGQIVAFPDDDCWYPIDLLERVNNFFQDNQTIDGLTSITRDKNGNKSVQKYSNANGRVSARNVWFKGNSTTIFVRKFKLDNLENYFDENLGVGSGTKWGGCEDIDFLIRLIQSGAKIEYHTEFFVYHPQIEITDRKEYILRNKKYSLGTGYTLKKNDFSTFQVFYFVLRPLTGAFISILLFNKLKAQVRFIRARGIFEGWMST